MEKAKEFTRESIINTATLYKEITAGSTRKN
jgi:hypothetical protein